MSVGSVGSVGSVVSVKSVESVQSVKSAESVQSDISQCKSVRYFVQTVCTSVLAHLRVDFRAFFFGSACVLNRQSNAEDAFMNARSVIEIEGRVC